MTLVFKVRIISVYIYILVMVNMPVADAWRQILNRDSKVHGANMGANMGPNTQCTIFRSSINHKAIQINLLVLSHVVEHIFGQWSFNKCGGHVHQKLIFLQYQGHLFTAQTQCRHPLMKPNICIITAPG